MEQAAAQQRIRRRSLRIFGMNWRVESLAHLTCVLNKSRSADCDREFKALGIEESFTRFEGDFGGNGLSIGRPISLCVRTGRGDSAIGRLCIGAACYPEGHVENEHKEG